MTGFGRAEHASDQLIARVEISSVNRKQGEVVVQMPRSYSELEARIRKIVLSQLSRGRIQLAISIEKSSTAGSQVCLLYTSPSPRDKRQSRMPSSA